MWTTHDLLRRENIFTLEIWLQWETIQITQKKESQPLTFE